MIVVDASVVIDLFKDPTGTRSIRERLLPSASALHAPEIIDLEVLHVFRRLVSRAELTLPYADAALREYRNFALRRTSHAPLLHRIWQLRQNITAYDAAYVALAESLDAPLLTRDRRLANAGGHTARIELV